MRALSRQNCLDLLESFRLSPGNGSAAARHAKVDPKTARKAWEIGLKVIGFVRYSRPFKDIIAEEQVEARARMQEDREKIRVRSLEQEVERLRQTQERAIKDITDTRKSEAALVRAARTTTGQALGALAQTGAGVAKVAQLVRKAMEQLVIQGDTGVVYVVTDPESYQMDLQDGLDPRIHLKPMNLDQAKGYSKTLASFATALRQVNDAAQKAMEMERLLLGEPTKIIAHQHLDGMTNAEAKQHLQAANRAFDRFEGRGGSLGDGVQLADVGGDGDVEASDGGGKGQIH